VSHIEYFSLYTKSGDEVKAAAVTDRVLASDPGPKEYILVDNGKLQQIGRDVFKVVATDEILTRTPPPISH